MEIKPNTYYRTRDGRKAFVVGVYPPEIPSDHRCVGVIFHPCDTKVLSDEGWDCCGHYYGVRMEHDRDLIAEWKEPEVHETWLNLYSSVGYDKETVIKAAQQNQDMGPICAFKLRVVDGVAEIVEQFNHVRK